MALSTKELWMDFHNQNITRLCVVQNEKDTRKYNVHFCDEGIPIQLNSSDYELYIAEKKADGNKVLKACTINNDGTGLLVFDENMCISNGSAALQFILRNKKDNSWTRTIAFNARIHEAVLNNGDITSSTEFDVLSNLILKVEELDKVINDNEKIRQANEEVRKSNEVKRIDAENERISNENTRKSNETQRVNAENTRVKQENDRKTSEEKRINAENTRVSNENTRKANETQRQTNETTRTNAETKRVNAETDRQSKETARQQNENTRETNETTRQSNEKTRVSNETTRTNAESERIKNENTRISNENTRQTQETKRQNDTATAITNANNAAKNANDKANDLQDKLDDNYFVLTNELENSVSSTSTTHAPTAKAVKTAYDKAVSVENTINSNKSNWNDKYTKNEIDNKFSTLESNIDWKESVATFADIAKTYPNPEDGWTVNTKIDNLTYRYSGSAWVAISANAIPKATQSVDGLLAKEDKINYDDANSKKHTHSNKSILDNITSTLINTWNTVTNKLDKTGDASNTTTSFSTASIRSNISTGEKLAISLGKIAKWFSDLKNVAFTGSYNDLSDRPTVGNGTITIKQAGTNKGTFSMNQTGDTTIELSDNNTWRPVETLLTNQNLDAVVTPGFYNAGGGNTCANKPSGIDAFGLIVTHNAGGQYYTQMLFNNTRAISCRRYCISGTWGNWLEDKLSDTTYSNATTSTAGLMSPDDKTTLNNLKTGAVTGVKGNAETTYRTGGVNLTPANIGALPSNGNAVSASKLATTRNINGAKFDGTSDIQLPLYYSYSFGVTQNAIYYSSFCKMKKDNSTSECETTLLLSATGNFGGTVPGTYLISMSNRGQKATMTVICLQKSSQSDLTFGYYYDDTYFYFGVIRPTYSYSTNLTVLSKSASAETGKFLNSTTKPTNWVDVAITNSIGGDASTVNGHTVNADVPSNAKFTDTNTTYPFYQKNINGNFASSFRTETAGTSASGNFFSIIRNNTANVSGSPQYSSGMAWGINDTHGYLITSYNSELAYIGGGNGDKLNWIKQISFAGHTHNYAASSSAGGSASSAVKLDTATSGSATQPVYFSGGKPVACTYTLGKSVPSNAVFTDTTYSTGNSSTSGLTKLYGGTGTSTDGTMTQSAIKSALDNKLSLSGGTITGHIIPNNDEIFDLGHSDKKWDNIWAHTLEVDYVNAQDGIRGNLTGNADTATKAVKDSAGDNIITSYRKRMGAVPNNDFNNATVEGVYTYGSSTGIANSYTNGSIWGTLEVFNNGYNSTQGVAGTVIHQIAFTTNNQIYFRQRINASDWTLWKELTSKSSNGEIKVTNPTYSKGYVRAWVDSEGGNLEIQSPDGATTYQIDAYNNDIIRIFSNNSDGSHKFLKFNGKTGVLSADGGFAGNASTVNKHTVNADVPANAKFTDTNTTYSAGTGIGLSNTTFYNTGVRSIATGSTNGTIAVNTNGTVADVKVKGLNTLAYASGTWNKLTGTNCTLWYNEVAIYLEISAQNVNLTEYGGTATNKTIVVLPTNVTPTKGVFLGVISALNSAWMPLNKAVMCNINYNSHNLTLRPTEALSNVVLNLTAMFPRSLFTIT